MEGEEERSEKEGSFSQASIPKRIAIVIAGATVNIIFGLLVYFILMSTGATYVTNEISTVLDGYAAQETGLQQNDKIVELNGKKIKNKYDLNNAMNIATGTNNSENKNKSMQNYNGEEITLKIERNNSINPLQGCRSDRRNLLELRRSGALPPCLPGVRFLPRQAGDREEGRRIIPAPERARCWIAARSFVPQTITNQRLKLC